jgi:hypothetical protein
MNYNIKFQAGLMSSIKTRSLLDILDRDPSERLRGQSKTPEEPNGKY